MKQVIQGQRNNVEISVEPVKLKGIIGAASYAKIVGELEALAGDGGTVTLTGTDALLSLLEVVLWWKSQKVFAMCLEGKGGAKVVPWWRSVVVFRRHFGGEGRAWVYCGSHHFVVICAGKAVLTVKDRAWC
jgi:hypothetical protein